MFYVLVYLVSVMVKCNWWIWFMDEVHTRNNVDLDVLWTQLK